MRCTTESNQAVYFSVHSTSNSLDDSNKILFYLNLHQLEFSRQLDKKDTFCLVHVFETESNPVPLLLTLNTKLDLSQLINSLNYE
jgi:hypothetical protein